MNTIKSTEFAKYLYDNVRWIDSSFATFIDNWLKEEDQFNIYSYSVGEHFVEIGYTTIYRDEYSLDIDKTTFRDANVIEFDIIVEGVDSITSMINFHNEIVEYTNGSVNIDFVTSNRGIKMIVVFEHSPYYQQ